MANVVFPGNADVGGEDELAKLVGRLSSAEQHEELSIQSTGNPALDQARREAVLAEIRDTDPELREPPGAKRDDERGGAPSPRGDRS